MSDLNEFDVRATDLATSVEVVHESCGTTLGNGNTLSLAELVNAAAEHTCEHS